MIQDIKKLIEIVAYILTRNDGQMDYYNLIKECYIADRISIEKTGYAMSGDVYVSMNRGPVLKNVYSFIKNKNEDLNGQQYWNSFFEVEEHKIRLVKENVSHSTLSRCDINILNQVCQRFYKYSYEQMKSYAHSDGIFPEWQSVNKGEEKPIMLETIMKCLNFSKKDIDIMIKEQQSYDKEKLALCSLN